MRIRTGDIEINGIEYLKQPKNYIIGCPHCECTGYSMAMRRLIDLKGDSVRDSDKRFLCKFCKGKGMWLEERNEQETKEK